ncbi:MAG: hypothetical protein IMW89_22925 [Ktedonobacteraceae bacterium]|nr:hypothetical protein [Ktedonobacteraceae bacterium]
MEWLILLIILIVFDIAALRLGYDSRERMHSLEWERRRMFYTPRSPHH